MKRVVQKEGGGGEKGRENKKKEETAWKNTKAENDIQPPSAIPRVFCI